MPQLTVSVRDTKGTLGGPDLNRRLKALVDADAAAMRMAARVATASTRANFSYRREPIAPRAGRSSTGGRMKQHLLWTVRNGRVEFDMAEADARVPHWIIQEIGTGQEARVGLIGGKEMSVEVPSQDGRDLPDGFIWADGAVSLMSEGGKFQSVVGGTSRRVGASKRRVPAPFGHGRDRPGMMDQQNLYPIAMLPPGQAYRQTRGVIHREIKGKHFVRDGGIEGNSLLRSALLSDFEDTFR